MESHVHCFGAFGLYLAIDYCDGRRFLVVCGRGCLCPNSSRMIFDDVGNVEDSAVVGWYGRVAREEEVPAGSASVLGLAKVTCVAVDR